MLQRITFVIIAFLFVFESQTFGQGLMAKEVEDVFLVVEDMPIPWFYKTECLSELDKNKRMCYEQKLTEYLYKNIKYPTNAVINKTEGTVVIQFVISKNGAIVDAEIMKDIGDDCGVEALKIVEQMPNWIPGKQGGIPVNVRYTLPIKFKIK